MKKFVLASGNKGKVREFNEMLAEDDIEVVPQSEFGVPEAEETGLTFVENAIIKARNAAKFTGLPAIADDSGIEVDYLKGAPGIYSARYAGVGAGDEANLQKLMEQMRGVSEVERGARFRCLIVCLRHELDPTPIICQGTWEGRLAFDRAGSNGFGYDPIFFVPEYNRMAAELPPEIKNRLSHRGQALRQLVAALKA